MRKTLFLLIVSIVLLAVGCNAELDVAPTIAEESIFAGKEITMATEVKKPKCSRNL